MLNIYSPINNDTDSTLICYHFKSVMDESGRFYILLSLSLIFIIYK